MLEDTMTTPYLTVLEYLGDPPSRMTTIDMMVHSMEDVEELTKVKLLRSVQIREMSSSTYIGHGLAVPHARMEELDHISISVGYFEGGIPWPDTEHKAELVVLLAVPHSFVQAYLLFLRKFVNWYKGIDESERRKRWNHPGQLEEDISRLLDLESISE